MKPDLQSITLIAIDTTDKAILATRAIEKSLEQCSFGAVKLLTHDTSLPHAIKIDRLNGLEGYSKFCIRDLHRFVDTPHCLLIQYDGYVINGDGWHDEFLKWDYIGAPFNPMGIVGNGGFSLRSRKLLKTCAALTTNDNEHPEDNWISYRHRDELQAKGMLFPPCALAYMFAFEGRVYDKSFWSSIPQIWNGQFGFHSWLSPLPETIDKPMIFHHSGDAGDVIYSLPIMKSLGGGVLFLSPDCRYGGPFKSRWSTSRGNPEWANNVGRLCNTQPYVWNTIYTTSTPHSTDIDFNRFRKCYTSNSYDRWTSLFALHQKEFGLDLPENEPWLTIQDPVIIPDRPIVVNRTERYRNPEFPWMQLVERHWKQMVFVGTPLEYDVFNCLCVPPQVVPYHPTDSLLDVARVIAGSKVFIGNQSCPMAIALGLGKNLIQEVWAGNPNCILKRDNAIYARGKHADIPESWLK